MMNDVTLKDHAAVVVSEPYVVEMKGKILTSPREHQGWTAILSSERHDGRWAMRSMLWVRMDIEYEQVRVLSADLTVVVLRLPDRSVLLASVYVEGGNFAALEVTIDLLRRYKMFDAVVVHTWISLSPATSTATASCGVEMEYCRTDRERRILSLTS